MGYQESFIFCKNKSDLIKLCKVLNDNFEEMSDFVITNMVCRYKKPIHSAFCEYESFSKKGYFVYWMGERHPIQSGSWLEDKLNESSCNFSEFPFSVYCENIAEVDDMFENWEKWREDDENSYQNDLVDILLLNPDEKIDLKRVKGL